MTSAFYNYFVAIVVMMVGLYIMIASPRRIKKLMGMGIFQVSVLLFYISLAYIDGSVAPIVSADSTAIYANPLPHVLMLTAIVVGVATLALGLSLVVLIEKAPK